jgi:hypothetical protein
MGAEPHMGLVTVDAEESESRTGCPTNVVKGKRRE